MIDNSAIEINNLFMVNNTSEKQVPTKEMVYKKLANAFSQQMFVFFGSGTSMAVDSGFGMEALAKNLKDKLSTELDDAEKKDWEEVIKSLEKTDFETAMNNVKNESLQQKIIDETAQHIRSKDDEYKIPILNGKQSWPAIEIIDRLANKDGGTGSRVLHVATTNYDMLAEFAFVQRGIPYITGFRGGIVRKLDWKQAIDCMKYREHVNQNRKNSIAYRTRPHVRLYKVHGSLNTWIWNNDVVETDIWNNSNKPEKSHRMMVVPGSGKYQSIAEEREILIKHFDMAVSKHSAFLFLGFGFNDSHLLNNSLQSKLMQYDHSCIIITMDLNPRIENIAQNGPNIWIVCKQEDNQSTRIFNRNHGWFNMDNKQLWMFDVFASEILGG